jgi:TPR repeat protein
LRRQAPVGQPLTFGYQAAARPNSAETPDKKGVPASGPREDRPYRRNGDPGDIKASPTDINAAFNLGVLLEERKDLPAAEAAYRRADEGGHAAAAANLGVLLEGQGDRTGAEAAYRRADQRGEANGSFNLGVLLEAREDLAGAEAAYRRADERGHAAAAANLGVLLEGQGDRTGAEAAYRRADQRGEANGSFNLGVLLEETDDLGGAEAAYRRAEQSAVLKVAQLARGARLELTAGIGVSGVAHNGGDVDGT